ncbi:TonB-dependent receptor [Sphingopyxis sp. USTB-05]|uniref:TonB-dependent receptor n=1 Tax=Sphingopyxis sp. USTB-05 TaxID=2830667 RepID=UPI002078D5EC|nr:TonB-dependent receptor [Sphingopyxis sp. USTB-05]USI79487.1 TonB-dependent receptor [Sphingopyxis sp. USTB-05]
MTIRFQGISTMAMIAAAMIAAVPAHAQDSDVPAVSDDTAAPDDTASMGEITVTARRRSERLQSVPDSITAFTELTIANANIKNIADLAKVTPGMNFRDGRSFAANFFDIRMRGIGTAQRGWASTALIVDGVPSDSADALTGATLSDVARIEVLRGPQSALYGSGAIAGAINVISKRPSNEFQAEGRFFYGNGQNAQAQGAISGALIPSKILGRLSVNYVNDNGRINSATNGMHLDPRDRKLVDGRLLFVPSERLEIDLRGSYSSERGGYAFQGRVPRTEDIDNEDLVVFARATQGIQTRKFTRLSGRLTWDFDGFTMTSVGSYSKTRQYGFGSACYDDVDNPNFVLPTGGVGCLSYPAINGPAFGRGATTGQVQDVFTAGRDDYRTYFGDFRLASSGGGAFSWLVGGSAMNRHSFSTGENFRRVAGNPADVPFSPRADLRVDKWWGAYGQVGLKAGKFEFTANARYDHQNYSNTSYANKTATTIVPVRDPDTGLPVPKSLDQARRFQPKVQISYSFDADRMGYVTVSRGFRAGFYNNGQFSAPEQTTNYEIGLKTQWLDRRLLWNVAAFRIDYSNQQISQNSNNPPFRIPVVIPKTTIHGAEFETSYRFSEAFTLSANLAYLHARVDPSATVLTKTWSPKSPKLSGSVAAQLYLPINDVWTLNARSDFNFHSSQFLNPFNQQMVGNKQYLNARVGVEREGWGIYAVGSNLTNETEDQIATSTNGPHRVVYPVEPRSYGVEVRVKF